MAGSWGSRISSFGKKCVCGYAEAVVKSSIGGVEGPEDDSSDGREVSEGVGETAKYGIGEYTTFVGAKWTCFGICSSPGFLCEVKAGK